MNAEGLLVESDTTSRVIKCAYRVSNALGAGFLEKVYENALAVEMRLAGLHFHQQHPFHVRYREEIVGDYVADFVVQDSVVVEIKAIPSLGPVQLAQCINYLRSSGLSLGLLLNFGRPRLEIRRVAWRF